MKFLEGDFVFTCIFQNLTQHVSKTACNQSLKSGRKKVRESENKEKQGKANLCEF
jgi:hypothetical protein